MTPQERKVFELALAALEAALSDDKPYIENSKQAITAIKQVLAQPEQHTLTSRVNDVRFHKERDEQRAEAMRMLAQPEQKPVGCIPWHWVDKAKQIADGTIAYPDVERAQQAIALIKILLKSTPPKPEPVAWQRDVGTGRKFMPHGVLPSVGKETGWTPLYTTPPQPEQRSVSEHLEPVAKKMTAHRAVYFMERFKHDEKLLGPNEQAALDFVISMLEAQPPQRKPLTDDEIYLATNQIDRNERGWAVKFARAIEAAHGIKE